jgi:tetratricopeptide (TPR) repeat protein
MASGAANAMWDKDGHRAILVRQVRLTRAAGALEQLPFALVSLAMADAWRGDFTGADSLLAEADAVCDATGGGRMARYTALLVAALRGNQAEVAPLLEEAIAEAEAEGQGGNAAYAYWDTAILHNGLGRYADALAAAKQATGDAHVYISMWALPDLIEAAVRTGNVQIAAGALERLAETTQAGGTDFGLGLESRCRALVHKGETAEGCYREAVDRLGRARMRPDLARAHLLYGEWLRRENRRVDARAHLRTAYEMLDAIGMEAFAERATSSTSGRGTRTRCR